MPYKLVSADAQKVVFHRSSVVGGMILALVVGSIFVGVGVWVHFGLPEQHPSFILLKIVFPFLGIMAILAGLRAPQHARVSIPEAITFDNQKGAVVIEMAVGTREVAYIPYADIAKFDIHVQRSRSSSNKQVEYTYHTLFRKRDGGEWLLTQPSSHSKAAETIEKLNQYVDLTRPFAVTTPPFVTDKISRLEGADKTIIHWQNKVSFMSVAFVVVVAVVFIVVIGFSVAPGTDGPLAYLGGISIGITVLIFVVVMAFAIRYLIRQATTRYAVAIGTREVEYYEFSKSNGVMRNSKSIPLTLVKGVVYNFSPTKGNLSPGLKIMTEKDIAAHEAAAHDPVLALKNLFSGKNKPMTLAIHSLTPVECLQLENWLQELIRKKGHESVQ